MSGERRQRLIALAIVALVPTILFADVLFGLSSLFIRDVSHYHYPQHHMLRDVVLGGEFPWWNPYMSAGQPIAANPVYRVFYPLTWLILLPDYHTGFHLLILVHLYIAAFGMYALLRSMEVSRTAAVFGAVSFSVGGLMVSMLNLFPLLFSAAWIPCTCLFARRFLLQRNAKNFALAAAFLGIQLLIGEPVTAFQSGLLLGLYALYRAHRDGWRTAPVQVGAIGAVAIAALLLSAVQTLPAADHVSSAARGRGIDFDEVRDWSTPPLRFTEFVFPNILGRVDMGGTPVFWGSKLYPRRDTALVYSLYSGLAIALLAAGGVLRRLRGSGLFVAAVAIAAIAAAGQHTPLLEWLYRTGVASLFRFPEKFTTMLVFAVVVFGAVAFDALLGGDERLRRIVLILAGAVALLAFAAALVTSSAWFEGAIRSAFSIRPGRAIEPLLALFRREWLTAGLRAALLLLLVRNVAAVRRPLWLALFGGFVLLDLAPQTPQIAPRIDPSYYREIPAVVKQFHRDRDQYRIFHIAHLHPVPTLASRFMGIDAVYPWAQRNALTPMFPGAYGLRTVLDRDLDLSDLAPEHDFTKAVVELARLGAPGWLDSITAMSNAWYVGLYQSKEKALAAAGGWNPDVQPVKFVEGLHHPRYWFASELVAVRDWRDFVRVLQTRRFSRTAAFIDEPPFLPAPGVVHSVRERASSARLEIEAAGRAFLVMSVTPHKYWRITVDGEEVPALVANIGFQGVVIPEGRHVVEMRYRNPLVPAGAAVSAATLLALLFFALRRPSTMRAL